MGKKIDRLTECLVSAFRKLYPNIVLYYQFSDEDIMRLYSCTTRKYRDSLEDIISKFLLHGEVLPF